MNIFRHLVCVDINRGIREFQAEKNAVLVDVRSREEYDRKHIENSRSLPLSDLDRAAEQVLSEKDVPVYVYAYGGEHSAKAASRWGCRRSFSAWNVGGTLQAPAIHSSEVSTDAPTPAMSRRLLRWISSVFEEVQSDRTMTS